MSYKIVVTTVHTIDNAAGLEWTMRQFMQGALTPNEREALREGKTVKLVDRVPTQGVCLQTAVTLFEDGK